MSLTLQNAIVSFKELCGLSAVANLKQCILALSSRLTGPENTPVLLFNLKDQYPSMEPQGVLPEVLKKVVFAYDTVRCLSSQPETLKKNTLCHHKVHTLL